jgi:hypothetical protein
MRDDQRRSAITIGTSSFPTASAALVSGNVYEIRNLANVTLLQNTVMIIQERDPQFDEEGYDVIAFRNIERIEQMRTNRNTGL